MLNILVPRPSVALKTKYQLMGVGDEAQVLIMPHVTKVHIDELVVDFARELDDGKLSATSKRIQTLMKSKALRKSKTTG